jgi:protein-S-isoprenylcysteine O-methyltransferase Ste14
MKKRGIHAGEFIWIIQLICIASDIVWVLWLRSNAFRITFLRANPSISLISIAMGVILLVSGSIIGYVSHASFNRAVSKRGQIQYLIKDGVYGFCRHPFYLSQILISFSLILFFHSYILLAGWLVVTYILVREARKEEIHLIKAFGEAYAAYRRETGMFFPRYYSRR